MRQKGETTFFSYCRENRLVNPGDESKSEIDPRSEVFDVLEHWGYADIIGVDTWSLEQELVDKGFDLRILITMQLTVWMSAEDRVSHAIGDAKTLPYPTGSIDRNIT